MNEAAQLAASAAVPPGWKWLAVLIGLAVLALLYLMTAVFGSWNPWKLVEGADGRASTSKFQWMLWIVVIIFAYTVLWILRAKQGNYSAISRVPVNLLTILGFSTGTAAAAKGITSGYVQTNRVAKPAVAKQGVPAGTSQGGILQDDTGVPELAKIQMIGFTLIAVGIFLATLIHQIVSEPVITSLPDVDSSLLVLMGISQGGYLGKKLVTFGAPTLYPPVPPEAAAGTPITLPGVNLGNPPVGSGLSSPPGSQLTLNSVPISPSSWSDTSIVFNVPGTSPVGNVPWTPPTQTIQLAVTVGGQTSNSVAFTVTSLYSG
jgi:hypothetical protein